jgi:hypothetical protein
MLNRVKDTRFHCKIRRALTLTLRIEWVDSCLAVQEMDLSKR